jgi:hypothetical protein
MPSNDSFGVGSFVLRAVALAAVVGFALAGALTASSRSAGRAALISPRPTAEEFSRAHFSNPLTIDNSWTPMAPGTEFLLDGVHRVGGKALRHRIESLMTNMTKVVDGIPTAVVLERDFSLGRLEESELFFAAQDDNKNVWLFGEYPALYEHGRFEGAPETWVAPTFGTQPGIFMYQSPRVGQIFSQGYAPHIRFYDRARVLRQGLKMCVPRKCYRNVMEVDEYAPYNPGDGHQRKFYAQGFGTIFARPVGEPHPETVSLAKVVHLGPSALAAAGRVVLKAEAQAYKVSDAYRQTTPIVSR